MVARTRRNRADKGTGRGGRSGGRACAAPGEPRPGVYAEVTARIVAELEAGRFPGRNHGAAHAAHAPHPAQRHDRSRLFGH